MESERHGVLHRRAHRGRDAKRDGGTRSGEEQEAKMAQILGLKEGPPVFCKSIIVKEVKVLCFDRLLKVYHS
jgi:hypothetical protein